jgi:tetratricopeptide (TPR) repeat protein
VKATPPPEPAPSETLPAPHAVETPPADTAPADASPPVDQPTAKEPPRPVTWPEWFGAVDVALVAMVIIVAFLAASFAARNSDLWLHLANGRILVEGNYAPGSDPFTFSGSERAWADSSWLFDLGLYAVYSADESGAAVVAVKAVAFATAFGLLFFLRRPGQPLWPWAVFVVLGILSAAPYAQVRPSVASMLFFAVTLLLVYRWPWQPGAWRQPLLLAGLFLVWANTDAWFFLGPMTVALVLVGELLHPLLTRESGPQADEPFPQAPPTGMLLRALVLGVVACLLNPMFLAAAAKDPAEAFGQLVPAELGFGVPAGTETDSELGVLDLQPWPAASFDDYFFFRPGRPDEQVKLPSVAFALLALGSVAALAAGFARLRATHLVLWIAFAALALAHTRLVPYIALAAAPLAAAHLNGLSSRVRLSTWTDTQTRLALTGSAVGRVLTVIAVLLLIGAAYPGWLHHPPTDPALANRLEWRVEPDAGLVRAVKVLPGLRAGLSETVRGLNASAALGDYCAWYAPGEKVFVNTRYNFHRPELPDLLAVRQALSGRRDPGERPDTGEVWRVCEDRRAGFLVMASRTRLDDLAVIALLQEPARWVLWHLDGRSAVFGRPEVVEPSAAVKLQFDPARLAFGPDQEPMPEGKALRPLRPPETAWDAFWDEYLIRPEPFPPEADDVGLLETYRTVLTIQSNERWERRARAVSNEVTAAVSGVAAGVGWVQSHPPIVEDARYALPVLVVRSARRAVAANPDRPEVYHALALAYHNDTLVPVSDQDLPIVMMPEQQLQFVTALARFLARVPPPDQCPPGLVRPAYLSARQLTVMYQQTGQLDLAREAFGRAVGFLERRPGELRDMVPPAAKPDDDPVRAELQRMRDEEDRLARAVRQLSDQVDRQPTPSRRFQAADMGGPQGRLPGKAIQVFRDTDINEFGAEQVPVVLRLIVLELQAGRLEDAADHIEQLDEQLREAPARQAGDEIAVALKILRGIKYRLEGNYAAAAEAADLSSPGPIDPSLIRQWETAPQLVAGLIGVAASPVATASQLMGGLDLVQRLQVQQMLLQEAAYQYDRALLAVNDANIPEARRRFEQAARPHGVDLARLGDTARLGHINRYLELIRKYHGPDLAPGGPRRLEPRP